MSDIRISSDPRFDAAEAEALTPAGVEFVDAYTAIDLEVIDSGRILLPADGIWAFKTRAREAGLEVTP